MSPRVKVSEGMEVSGEGSTGSLPNAQAAKRPAESPLPQRGREQRARRGTTTSLEEDLHQLLSNDSPTEPTKKLPSSHGPCRVLLLVGVQVGVPQKGGSEKENRKWKEGASRPPTCFWDREEVSRVVGMTREEARRVWRNVAHPALRNQDKDFSWMVAHEILPVRAVMHSQGMGAMAVCPRPGCGQPETVRHVFWVCSVARDLWAAIGPLKCPSLPAGEVHPLEYRQAVLGVGWGLHQLPAKDFEQLWLTLNSVKAALWTSRNLLVGKHVTVPLHALIKLVTVKTLQVAPGDDIRRRGPRLHAGGSLPPSTRAPADVP
ncbi:uncharacterized protein LOC143522501 [Brachyhypopomus gauderio]|uniref:uncharacterized protein LOC143522501 n=1 Tax=Brachyhypopomus gauderio TaxID=698409 RepID=UPI0040410AF8